MFDFGGSTLDISVLSIADGVIDVCATKGDMKLGGRDIDQRLAAYCIEKFKETSGIDLSNNDEAKKVLRKACEKAKIELSSEDQTIVECKQILGGKDLKMTITRQDLEFKCSDLLCERLK